MNEFLKIMVMAVVQGVTEFLPVSSSGHLVLAKHFLGLESPGASLELFLHGGTLLAVVLYYWRKLFSLATGVLRCEKGSLLYAGWVLLSMVPAGILFALGGDDFEAAYDSPMFVGAMLCVTGLALTSLVFIRNRAERRRGFNWLDALLMGIAQAVAMLPGISRSGSTIFAARLAGVKPVEAAEFSLIMSIPVIAGALLVELLKSGSAVLELPLSSCLVGALVAAAVGFAAIGTLVKVLNHGRFWMFGIYCMVAGALSLILVSLGV